MLRAIVACGWFGIQTWIGGFAVYQMFRLWIPSLETLPHIFPASFGLQTVLLFAFILFWLLNMYVVYLGVESIKKLLVFKAFFLPLAALALLYWAINAVKVDWVRFLHSPHGLLQAQNSGIFLFRL